ncbi:hypothetical protein ILUMI_20909 [Ignelater luminosus]|uniref:PiggyBac transposable element-derived protein domain-containing protein n=1 Tax=Ignelater luminosus TaxID=2038154 RepID=A0A8K0G453_IGNLU|nr:hypothetical protein ILUMI_20909 [Ignelater luminosus]
MQENARKDVEVSKKYKNLGLGARVVLQLTEQEWEKYGIVFFDNYFTLLLLLEKLKVEKTLACGTIRQDMKSCPKHMAPDIMYL